MTDRVISDAGGTVTITSGVVCEVARRAAESVDGARVRRSRRGLSVDVDGARARVSVELAVRYGAVLPDVAGNVQQRIAAELRRMCGLDPAAIDVTVEELEVP